MSKIKPPSGPGGGPSIDGLDSATGPGSAGEVGRAGGTETTRSAEPAKESTQPAAAPEASGGLDAVAAEVHAGRMTPEAALEALVERALADVDPSLSPAQRAELEGVLRALAADDPTLAGLREGWGD